MTESVSPNEDSDLARALWKIPFQVAAVEHLFGLSRAMREGSLSARELTQVVVKALEDGHALLEAQMLVAAYAAREARRQAGVPDLPPGPPPDPSPDLPALRPKPQSKPGTPVIMCQKRKEQL